MLPQTNAILSDVAGGGTSEDYDAGEGADSSKWSGQASAYYQEKRQRVSSPSGSDLILGRVLIVETSLPIIWEEEDTVTFTFDGSARKADIQLIERRELEGMGSLATTRLTLENVRDL